MESLNDLVVGLSISSQSAGNTVAADNTSLAMTAPGSPSVLPVPDATDRLPQPELGPRRDLMWGTDHRPTDRPSEGDGGWRPSPWLGSEDGGGWTDTPIRP